MNERIDIAVMAQLRHALEDFARSQCDEKARRYPSLFEAWRPGAGYSQDDRVSFGGRLWRCLQSHLSQPDWTPEAAPSLWREAAAPGEYREIKSVMLSTEAFSAGEVGWYKNRDDLYRSLIDANVWTPEANPSGWERLEAEA